MTGSRIGAGVLGMCSVLALAGCESRVSLGSTCSFTSECPVGLSCTAGRCRAECLTERDCEDGRRCLRGPAGEGVCSAEPEDRCASVSDCGDPLFAACVGSRCQTGCTSEAECARGACVEGSCLEPTVQATPRVLGAVALGAAVPVTVSSGSFVIEDPDAPRSPLTLGTARGYTDLDLALEDATSGDIWALHVATMDSRGTEVGAPVLIDVDLVGASATRTARRSLAGSDATSVAAEAMADGRPAYLWVVEDPDPVSSPDYPLRFSFFTRGTDPVQSMGTEDDVTRFPAEAALATGLGLDDDQPAWGVRVFRPAGATAGQSYYMAVGPSGGAGSEVNLELPLTDDQPVDARGTRRGFLLRRADRSLHLARVFGTDIVDGRLFDLEASSSCVPGIADRSAVQDGNYVMATCSGPIIELRRIVCAADRPGERCVLQQWFQIEETSAPSELSLEAWPGGVVLVSRLEGGVSARVISDEATSAEGLPTFPDLLPDSYRVNALTDFRLRHVASTAASRDGASVLVVGGFYDEDNSVAQLRVRVVEVTPTP